jgi:NADH-quinone oxidoreductase subunit I/NAD(P)H-quinone oxidoreductase subunit I
VIQVVSEYFRNIINAVASIYHGLAVTLSYMVRKPITIQYPDRSPKPVVEMLPAGFRGILEVDIDKCIGDLACMRRCPLECIKMTTERDPETKEFFITRFDIDVARCMVCGLCSEACVTGAIHHSTEFEASTANVINLVYQYVKPGTRVAAYKMVKGEEPKLRPQNEAFRERKKAWDAPAPFSPDIVRGDVRWKATNIASASGNDIEESSAVSKEKKP